MSPHGLGHDRVPGCAAVLEEKAKALREEAEQAELAPNKNLEARPPSRRMNRREQTPRKALPRRRR